MFYYQTKDDINFPCVALSINSFLEEFQIDCKDKEVVILGTSYLVGHPTYTLFESKGAKVVMENEFDSKLAQKVKAADIVVAALGRGKILSENDVKNGAIVFDVGIRLDDCEGCTTLSGDTDYKAVKLKATEHGEVYYPSSGRNWTADCGLDAPQFISLL